VALEDAGEGGRGAGKTPLNVKEPIGQQSGESSAVERNRCVIRADGERDGQIADRRSAGEQVTLLRKQSQTSACA
jgi:hypothetical protein